MGRYVRDSNQKPIFTLIIKDIQDDDWLKKRKMEEQLGIIEDIHVGCRDISSVICWFTVKILDGASLQVITIEEMVNMLKNIYKLEDLEGKPCIVETDGSKVKFKRLL